MFRPHTRQESLEIDSRPCSFKKSSGNSSVQLTWENLCPMGLNKTPLGPVTVDAQENLSLGPDANYTIYDYFPLMVSN